MIMFTGQEEAMKKVWVRANKNFEVISDVTNIAIHSRQLQIFFLLSKKMYFNIDIAGLQWQIQTPL